MKRIVAGVIYGVAFVVNLLMVYTLRVVEVRQDWVSMVEAMGVEPLPGTGYFLDTLQYWWIYPLVGVFVFAACFVYLKQSLLPCLLMGSITVVGLVYFYAPLVQVGALG